MSDAAVAYLRMADLPEILAKDFLSVSLFPRSVEFLTELGG
jgi:hypothetical protein